MKQLTIMDYERDVITEVLTTLEACKIANRTAYTNNIYWKMGFDTAYNVIVHELQKGEKNGCEGADEKISRAEISD